MSSNRQNEAVTAVKAVKEAAEVLRGGGLVAFPTETVYGLGADATNRDAVLRIFAAKGRPPTNPLIVHVANLAIAKRYAAAWPDRAQRLAERFWPGPLTLVLPKHPSIVPEATAGLNTVGLRCPDHPLALAMLEEFAGAVAAPSANRSTRVSPTTAQHVRDELGPAVDFILDGGPCRVGIESTVLDLLADPPRILRPGAVTARQIADVIGPVQTVATTIDPSQPATSPGQQLMHYAPHARAYRFDPADLPRVVQQCQISTAEPAAVLLIGTSNNAAFAALPLVRVVTMPEEPSEYARRLYATLRELDAQAVGVIWVEMPPVSPQWLAIRDRLIRASKPSNQ